MRDNTLQACRGFLRREHPPLLICHLPSTLEPWLADALQGIAILQAPQIGLQTRATALVKTASTPVGTVEEVMIEILSEVTARTWATRLAGSWRF